MRNPFIRLRYHYPGCARPERIISRDPLCPPAVTAWSAIVFLLQRITANSITLPRTDSSHSKSEARGRGRLGSLDVGASAQGSILIRRNYLTAIVGDDLPEDEDVQAVLEKPDRAVTEGGVHAAWVVRERLLVAAGLIGRSECRVTRLGVWPLSIHGPPLVVEDPGDADARTVGLAPAPGTSLSLRDGTRDVWLQW